ncbi:MAG: hypothetical protein ACM3NF_06155 [Gemmatimonadota bacterium]
MTAGVPYLFIAAVVAAVVVLLGGFAVACRVAPPLRPLFPFAWRIFLWSTVGVLVANGAVLLLFLVPAPPSSGPAGGPGASDAWKIGLAAGLLLGPVAATALGFVAGSTFGVFLALRSLRPAPAGRHGDRGPA